LAIWRKAERKDNLPTNYTAHILKLHNAHFYFTFNFENILVLLTVTMMKPNDEQNGTVIVR